MRTWWVNQNQTFRQEQDGGYLWSPKRNKNNSRNHFYAAMRLVSPGDIILSFKDKYLPSVGIAKSYCYESPKPLEFGTKGLNWNRIGWRIDVGWRALDNPIRPADHMARLRPTLPAKYSPLQANGKGLQGVYLTEIPAPMMRVLADEIGYELRVLLDAPQEPLPLLVADRPEASSRLKEQWEQQISRSIRDDRTIKETEKTALIKARRGQGRFRDNVRSVEKHCRVTHVENPEHLIASHCKPWRHANHDERLDGENGLLLTPTVDHLFDRGFISFRDDGLLLISPVADKTSLERMHIDTSGTFNAGDFSSGQKRHLDYHRNEIFLEA